MKNLIWQAETVEMKSLSNLFITMTSKSCNNHCKHCYIDFPMYKRGEDFIKTEIIQKAIEDTKQEPVQCIYLTGAEPMTHPDFNAILRLCLKRCNVCICTNGSLINEKKARFFKKVSEETSNEIIFKISIDHYDEMKNDSIRYRGAFRQAWFAIKALQKYNFSPIIAVTNYYNEPKEDIYNGFKELFNNLNYDLDSNHIIISPWHDKNKTSETPAEYRDQKLDCKNSRVLSDKGIYSCPFLSNDYRGRCGNDFNDYMKKTTLETDFCQTCLKSKDPIFSIDFSKFE